MWNNPGQGYGDTGGGYLNSPGGMGSPQMSQDRKNKQRAQMMTPCTISQILSAEQVDDKFIYDNIDLHQVTIVGLIRSVKESSTKIEYELDDMTGPTLSVRQFVDNDENTPDDEHTAPMRENTYVRVFGHARAFGEKRNISAFRIMPLLDMNELTTHLLEVIHTHLSVSKGQGANGQNAGGGNDDVGSYGNGNGMQTGYDAMQGDMSGLSNIQQQVSLIIRSCHDDQGINVNSICDRLRGLPQKTIREAIEFLSGEGHIYSTIDDEHFKSTDAAD